MTDKNVLRVATQLLAYFHLMLSHEIIMKNKYFYKQN